MLSSIARPVYILFCALLTVPVALAQENVTSASVSGRVWIHRTRLFKAHR